jgi:hypothetical protein
MNEVWKSGACLLETEGSRLSHCLTSSKVHCLDRIRTHTSTIIQPLFVEAGSFEMVLRNAYRI